MEPCDLLAVELRLDRIDAALARELPLHVRAFAEAYASGRAPPPAPELLRRPTTLATARAALVHPVLADRGLALVRLIAPLAIEADAAVAAARAAPPSWDALAALVRARDLAARARFGRRAIEVSHALDGAAQREDEPAVTATAQAVRTGRLAVEPSRSEGASPERLRITLAPYRRDRRSSSGEADRQRVGIDRFSPSEAALPPREPAWDAPDGLEVDGDGLSRAWAGLCDRHGVGGVVRFMPGGVARPRTFVVEPGVEVVVVIPSTVATPAARFAVLHELGHAVAALALPPGIPRAVDEAAASYVARAIERQADGEWYSALGHTARRRRTALAAALDRLERALPELPSPGARPAAQPPWALWHDPGAQAAYVAAETLADELERAIGCAPAAGALTAALAAQRSAIDRRGATWA